MPLLEKHLIIKKSKLPGAGKGLFTKKKIEKGTRIVEYKGKIQPWREVKHEDGHNAYLMYINRSTVINAKSAMKAFARYANDANGLTKVEGLRNNSENISEGRKCFIEAKRDIEAGEEILVGYGRWFWTLQRKLMKEKLKQN
jgi:uncharacterized protein